MEGGSANDYDYAGADPCNNADLDGMAKCHLHHIVARKAGQAQPARDVLDQHDIWINDRDNLVFIDADAHIKIVHGSQREFNYTEVNRRIGAVRRTEKAVRAELRTIGSELRRKYPCELSLKQKLQQHIIRSPHILS